MLDPGLNGLLQELFVRICEGACCDEVRDLADVLGVEEVTERSVAEVVEGYAMSQTLFAKFIRRVVCDNTCTLSALNTANLEVHDRFSWDLQNPVLPPDTSELHYVTFISHFIATLALYNDLQNIPRYYVNPSTLSFQDIQAERWLFVNAFIAKMKCQFYGANESQKCEFIEEVVKRSLGLECGGKAVVVKVFSGECLERVQAVFAKFWHRSDLSILQGEKLLAQHRHDGLRAEHFARLLSFFSIAPNTEVDSSCLGSHHSFSAIMSSPHTLHSELNLQDFIDTLSILATTRILTEKSTPEGYVDGVLSELKRILEELKIFDQLGEVLPRAHLESFLRKAGHSSDVDVERMGGRSASLSRRSGSSSAGGGWGGRSRVASSSARSMPVSSKDGGGSVALSTELSYASLRSALLRIFAAYAGYRNSENVRPAVTQMQLKQLHSDLCRPGKGGYSDFAVWRFAAEREGKEIGFGAFERIICHIAQVWRAKSHAMEGVAVYAFMREVVWCCPAVKRTAPSLGGVYTIATEVGEFEVASELLPLPPSVGALYESCGAGSFETMKDLDLAPTALLRKMYRMSAVAGCITAPDGVHLTELSFLDLLLRLGDFKYAKSPVCRNVNDRLAALVSHMFMALSGKR